MAVPWYRQSCFLRILINVLALVPSNPKPMIAHCTVSPYGVCAKASVIKMLDWWFLKIVDFSSKWPWPMVGKGNKFKVARAAPHIYQQFEAYHSYLSDKQTDERSIHTGTRNPPPFVQCTERQYRH
jgi:hypothetical protein